MSRSGIIGSYCSSVFSVLRNLLTAFHSGYTNLHIHQQWMGVPVSPLPHQNLLLLLSLIMSILTRMRWNLMVVFICISFIAREVEHLFLCLLAICVFTFENPLFNSCVPISSLGSWFFRGWVFWVPCRFWVLVPHWMSSWQRFSPIRWAVFWVWWLFPLLCRKKLFSMM
jgi:hypothetical protein